MSARRNAQSQQFLIIMPECQTKTRILEKSKISTRPPVPLAQSLQGGHCLESNSRRPSKSLSSIESGIRLGTYVPIIDQSISLIFVRAIHSKLVHIMSRTEGPPKQSYIFDVQDRRFTLKVFVLSTIFSMGFSFLSMAAGFFVAVDTASKDLKPLLMDLTRSHLINGTVS